MSSSGTAPIDIPQKRSIMAVLPHNHGQHTANFIDPNLMQLSPNHQTFPATASITEADKDKAEQAASRSMPPPPVPALSSHQAVTSTDHEAKYAAFTRQYGAYQAERAADFDKKAVTFDSKLTEVLAEIKEKEQQEQQKTLVNDKPLLQSIVDHRHLSDTQKSRPNVYATPYSYEVDPSGARVVPTMEQEGTTKYGKGLHSKVVEEEEGGSGLGDREKWVEVQQNIRKDAGGGAAAAGDPMDREWVRIEIERRRALSGGYHHHRLVTTGIPGVGVTGGLAESFFAGRSVAEKKKIEGEMKRMGWSFGG